jgi:hypothetical protein
MRNATSDIAAREMNRNLVDVLLKSTNGVTNPALHTGANRLVHLNAF